MQAINGVIRHYAWGDQRAIPDLLGVPADGRPWAELWLGTHDSGPATLADGRPLASVTGPLPYLLKVLAAAEPLSLQVHPDAERARAGFAAGRYPDPNPKPELLVALGPFEAFCGIRPPAATAALLDELGEGARGLADALDGRGPAAALTELYLRHLPVEPIVAACADSERPEARWVTTLATRYPDDPSVAVTLLLNLVQLGPGEAITLGAGNLHAYLGGVGIEFMGASDNVVRGGLTSKPVDVDDLLSILDPTPLAEPVQAPRVVHPLPGTTLQLLRLEGPASRTAERHELVVTTAGTTGHLAPGERLDVAAGTTAFVATG